MFRFYCVEFTLSDFWLKYRPVFPQAFNILRLKWTRASYRWMGWFVGRWLHLISLLNEFLWCPPWGWPPRPRPQLGPAARPLQRLTAILLAAHPRIVGRLNWRKSREKRLYGRAAAVAAQWTSKEAGVRPQLDDVTHRRGKRSANRCN